MQHPPSHLFLPVKLAQLTFPATQDAPFLQIPQEEKYSLSFPWAAQSPSPGPSQQHSQAYPSAVWTWSDIVVGAADAVEFSSADAVERRSDATKRAATKTSARRFSFVVLVIVIFLFVFVFVFVRVREGCVCFLGLCARCVQKLTVLDPRPSPYQRTR